MARSKKYKYDVFISHAVEDKIPIAIELDKALRERGLAVWFSGKELSIGDRLTQSIYTGLDDCRFGVVILSPTYLSKAWPMAEFCTLVQREKEGHKVVLPVLFDITPQELAVKYPPMADIFSISASKGVDVVTEVIINEITKSHDGQYPAAPKNKALASVTRRAAIAMGVFLLALATVFGFWKMFPDNPSSQQVQEVIQQRIGQIQSNAQQSLQHVIQSYNGRQVTAEEIKKRYTEFIDAKSYYRNEYILNIGVEVIRSKRNVESTLAIDMGDITPFNQYDFTDPTIYLGEASSARSLGVILKSGTSEARIYVDAEGYRERRQQQLEEMAHRLGEKARREGKPVYLQDLSPRERRIIHQALQRDSRVSTKSVGEGEDRKLMIIPRRSR